MEVSTRTFFRYFSSKEEVALAPAHDMWAAFLTELGARSPAGGGTVLELLQDTLLATVTAMPREGWAQRVRQSHRLAESNPAVQAHGLQFCDSTTRDAITLLQDRFGFAVGDLRLRLAADLLVSAFHCALEEWASRPDPTGRDELVVCLREAFAAVPGCATLTVPGR